jgi:hypothetical protein
MVEGNWSGQRLQSVVDENGPAACLARRVERQQRPLEQPLGIVPFDRFGYSHAQRQSR